MLKKVNPFDLFIIDSREQSYNDFFEKFDNLIKFIFSLGPTSLQLFFFNKLTKRQKLFILLKHYSEKDYFSNLDELADSNYISSVDCVKENINQFIVTFDEMLKQSLKETDLRKYKLLYLISKKKYKETIENIENSKIIVTDISKAKVKIKQKYAQLLLTESNENEIQTLVKKRVNEIDSLFLESRLYSLKSIFEDIDIKHFNPQELIRIKSKDLDKGKLLDFNTISRNTTFVLSPIGAVNEINNLLEKELAELSDVNEILKCKKQAKFSIDNIIDINDIRYTLKQSISNSTDIDNLSLRKLLNYYNSLFDDNDTLKTLIEYLLNTINEEITNLLLEKCSDIDYDILCLINTNPSFDNLHKLLRYFHVNPKVERLMNKEDFVSFNSQLSPNKEYLHVMFSFRPEGGNFHGTRYLSYVLDLTESEDRTGNFKLLEKIPSFRSSFLSVTPLNFTTDENFIIYEGRLKLRLYKTKDFEEIYSLNKNNKHNYKFSNNGKYLAIVDFDNYFVQIVDINFPLKTIDRNFRKRYAQKFFNIKQIPVSNLKWGNEAKKEFLYSIEFSPNHRFIALKVCNMNSEYYLIILRKSDLLTVYEGSIFDGHYEFNESSNYLLIKKRNYYIVLDLNSQTIKYTINTSQYKHFFIDDKYLISTYPNTKILRLSDSKEVFISEYPGIGGGYKADISPNGRFIIIRQTSWGRVLLITKNSLDEFNEYLIIDYGFDIEGGVNEVKFSSDNKYLAIVKKGVVVVNLECNNNFNPKIITKTTEYISYIDFSVDNNFLCISDVYGVKVLRLYDNKIIFSENSDRFLDKRGFISADNSYLIIIDDTNNIIKYYDFSDFTLCFTSKVNIDIYYDDLYKKIKEQNNSFDLKDLKKITLYPTILRNSINKENTVNICSSNSGILKATFTNTGQVSISSTISEELVFKDNHIIRTYNDYNRNPDISVDQIESMSYSKDDSFFSSFGMRSSRLHISKIEDVGFFAKKIFIEHLIFFNYMKYKFSKSEITKLLHSINSSDSQLSIKQKEYLSSFINHTFLK